MPTIHISSSSCGSAPTRTAGRQRSKARSNTLSAARPCSRAAYVEGGEKRPAVALVFHGQDCPYHQAMDGGYGPRSTSDAPREHVKPRWDLLFSQLVLGWLALGGGAVVLGLYTVSASSVTNRTLLLAVALAGGGGGCVSATAALVSYIGERAFRVSWTAYFFFRPILGAAIAVLFYVTIRAGLVNGNAPPSTLNYYGFLAISLLVGLFSKGILDRLLDAYAVILGSSSSALAGLTARTKPSTPIAQLDAYRGYIVHELIRAPDVGSWLLRIWLQDERSEELPSQLLVVGDGKRANYVRFRFTVFQHDFRTVTPQTAIVGLRDIDGRSDPIAFTFDDHRRIGAPPPTVLIEVSQHGRTVAVLGTDEAALGSR